MLVRPVLLLSLLAAPLAHAADSVLLDLLPPNATFVIGVNVRNLANSAVVRSAMARAGSPAPQWTAMFQMIGFDPARDVDEVLLAVSGGGQNPPTLVAARGRFAGMRAMAAGQKGKNQFVFLDDNTVIGGDPAAVQAALRRRGSTAARGNALAVRVAAAAERYDVFGVGNIPAMPPGAPGPAAEVAKLLERFQFGISVTDGLQMTAEMEAKTAAAAQNLSKLISSSLRPDMGVGDVSKHLNVITEGRTVRLSLTLPQPEVEKLIQAGAKAAATQTALARAAMPAGTAFGVAASPAPEKSRVPPGAVLMITGSESDGGTIVVNRP